MAAITFRAQVKTTAAGAKTTAGFTPALDDLLVVLAFNSDRTAAQVPTITDSQGGSYARIPAADGTKRTSLDSHWLFVRTSLISSAVSTTVTTTPVATDTGGGLVVYTIAEMTRTGTSAVRQVAKQDNQASGTPSVTFGVALLTGNPTIGLVHTSQTGTTNTAPPTGWTEDSDSGYSTPNSGIETCRRDSGSTLTSVPWTAATTSAFGAYMAEFDASVATTPLTADITATFTVDVVKQVNKATAITVTVTPAVVRQVNKVYAITTTLTVAAVKRVNRVVTVGITFTVAALRRLNKVIPITTTFTVAATRAAIFARSVAITITFAVAHTRQAIYSRVIAIPITFAVTSTKQVNKVVGVVVSVGVESLRTMTKFVDVLVDFVHDVIVAPFFNPPPSDAEYNIEEDIEVGFDVQVGMDVLYVGLDDTENWNEETRALPPPPSVAKVDI